MKKLKLIYSFMKYNIKLRQKKLLTQFFTSKICKKFCLPDKNLGKF